MLTNLEIHPKPNLWQCNRYYRYADQAASEHKPALAACWYSYINYYYPGIKTIQFKLATHQMQLQYWSGAEELLLFLINPKSPDPNILCNLGICYWKQQRYKQALHYFKYNTIHFPYHLDTKQNLAALYLEFNRTSKAIGLYQDMLIYRHDPNIQFNLASCLQMLGIYDEALFHYRNIIQKYPQHYASLFNLGCIYDALRNHKAAAYYWKQCLKQQAYNPTLKFLYQRATQGTFSSEQYQHYVKDLFDHYAGFYDTHLTQTLHYQTPQILHQYLNQTFKQQTVNHILELGCGTGLCGAILKHFTDHLMGLDISKNMIQQAQKTQYYQQLLIMDIMQYFSQSSLKNHEFIIAIDVLPYLHDLEKLIAVISSSLTTQGHFIFTSEITFTTNQDLQNSGRIAYNPTYIEQLCTTMGLKCLKRFKIITRQDNHMPITEYFYHWTKMEVLNDDPQIK